MFNILRKFFSERESELLQLQLDQLPSFINDKSNEINKDLNQHIADIRTKISSEIGKTKMNLNVLKNAELRNKNIPIRARQFMDGNREAYIRAVNTIIDQIVIDDDYNKVLKFIADFDEKLKTFVKSTSLDSKTSFVTS